MSLEVQTRSDSFDGKYTGLNYFKSVKDAYGAYLQDKNIWKISFDEGKIARRWRPKTAEEKWNGFSETKMCSLNPKYKEAIEKKDTSMLFFVDQTMWVDYETEQRVRKEHGSDWENVVLSMCVRCVLTNDQFKKKYNI